MHIIGGVTRKFQSYADAYVTKHKVYNTPLKPQAELADLQPQSAFFRPACVLKDYVGDNIGLHKVLRRLVEIVKNYPDRYMLVCVDVGIYERVMKVSGSESVRLCALCECLSRPALSLCVSPWSPLYCLCSRMVTD